MVAKFTIVLFMLIFSSTCFAQDKSRQPRTAVKYLYYPNGKLRAKVVWDKKKRQIRETWYESGQRRSKGVYLNPMVDDSWAGHAWYENGAIMVQSSFLKEDFFYKRIRYFKNGSIFSINERKPLSIGYDQNGHNNYQNVFVSWFSTGEKDRESLFKVKVTNIQDVRVIQRESSEKYFYKKNIAAIERISNSVERVYLGNGAVKKWQEKYSCIVRTEQNQIVYQGGDKRKCTDAIAQITLPKETLPLSQDELNAAFNVHEEYFPEYYKRTYKIVSK